MHKKSCYERMTKLQLKNIARRNGVTWTTPRGKSKSKAQLVRGIMKAKKGKKSKKSTKKGGRFRFFKRRRDTSGTPEALKGAIADIKSINRHKRIADFKQCMRDSGIDDKNPNFWLQRARCERA